MGIDATPRSRGSAGSLSVSGARVVLLLAGDGRRYAQMAEVAIQICRRQQGAARPAPAFQRFAAPHTLCRASGSHGGSYHAAAAPLQPRERSARFARSYWRLKLL